ncbi:MAG: hypothetical protein U0324_15145 [Polyangiales bacterium]
MTRGLLRCRLLWIVGAMGCSELVGRTPASDGGADGPTRDVADADAPTRPTGDVPPTPGCATRADGTAGEEQVARAVDHTGTEVLGLKEFSTIADARGRVILLGTIMPTSAGSAAAVLRLLPDGTFDRTFGDNGRLLVRTGEPFSSFLGAAFDARGRIVLAGYTCDATGGCHGLVARVTDDGALDTAFASRGWARLGPEVSPASTFRAVAVRDDRIVAAGTNLGLYAPPTGGVAAVFRDDGALDRAFAGSGVYRDPARWFMSVAPHAEGFLLGGTERNGPHPSLLLLGPSGAPVRTYGEAGLAVLSSAYGDSFDVLPDGAGGALLGVNALAPSASFVDGNGHAFVARVTPEGNLDRAFGRGGLLALESGISHVYAVGRRLAAHCDGTFLYAGVALDWHTAMVARFTGRGALDPRFGDGGIAQVRGLAGAEFSGNAGVVVSPEDASAVAVVGTSTNNAVGLRYLRP